MTKQEFLAEVDKKLKDSRDPKLRAAFRCKENKRKYMMRKLMEKAKPLDLPKRNAKNAKPKLK